MLKHLLMALAILAVSQTTSIAQQTYVEGQDFVKLNPPVQTGQSTQIEVQVFFWYGSPQSQKLHKALSNWERSMATDVSLQRTPVVFNPAWKVNAHAFYAFQALGVLDRAHDAVYNAILNQRKRLATESAFSDFAKSIGINKSRFQKAFKSFNVRTNVLTATSLARNASISSVPTIVVAGKYKIGTFSAAKMLKIADFLIQKVRAGG